MNHSGLLAQCRVPPGSSSDHQCHITVITVCSKYTNWSWHSSKRSWLLCDQNSLMWACAHIYLTCTSLCEEGFEWRFEGTVPTPSQKYHNGGKDIWENELNWGVLKNLGSKPKHMEIPNTQILLGPWKRCLCWLSRAAGSLKPTQQCTAPRRRD